MLLSADSNTSGWVEKEINSVLRREDKDGRQILIPIKLDDSSTPRVLEDRHHLNFSNLFEDDAISDLLHHLTRAFEIDLTCGEISEGLGANGEGLFIGIDVGTTTPLLCFHSRKLATIDTRTKSSIRRLAKKRDITT